MDKFTVDLDQVLNDFEYSELTDHFGPSKSIAESHRHVTPHSHNITKHSINNVFHSLNEYLNTNINVGGLNIPDNNNVEIDVSISNPCLPIPKDETESIKECKTENEETFNGELSHSFINLPPHLPLDSNSDRNEKEVSQSVYEFLSNSTSREFEPSRHKTDCVELDPQVDQGEILQESNESLVNYNLEVSSEKVDLNIGSIEDNDFKNIAGIECNIPEKKLTVISNNYLDSGGTNNQTEKYIDVNATECEILKKKDTMFLGVEETEDVNTNAISTVTVGFEDEVDLDDAEISKLLTELEEDDDLKCSDTCESQSASDGCEITPKTNETSCSDNTFSQGSVDDGVLESIEAPREETVILNNTSDQCVEMQINEKNEVDDLEISNVSLRDEFLKVGENTLTNETFFDAFETEEEQKVADNENSEDKVELEIEKEISQDSLVRPHNLPLTDELQEASRKINLIGDPGSTPYNNVYINKEIQKQEYNHSDLESSTASTSPTFSDASSTASTASTEDIQDRNDLENFNSKPDNDSMLNLVDHQNNLENNPASESGDFVAAETLSTEDTQNSDNQANEVLEAESEVNNASDTTEQTEAELGSTENSNVSTDRQWLGKEAPLWVPDADATSCLHCDMKFTVLKRRHHCRACGLVLCSKCCNLRFRLEYLSAEARVCNKCHDILNQQSNSTSSSSDVSPETRRPHPNNPEDYCSTIPPLEQEAGDRNHIPTAVMVPVGVLKRQGSNKSKSGKSVMFCDGIRPGSDLTNLDNDFNYNNTKTKKLEKSNITSASKVSRNLPLIDSETNTFIPKSDNSLPPLVTICKSDVSYTECSNNPTTVETLKTEQLTFAIHISLFVHLKIIDMSCCVNKTAWCFSTEGLINVGQDEVVVLLECIEGESYVPKDVFYHINNIYNEAVKGNSVKELGVSLHTAPNFLDSKNHAGFIFVRPTFQCLENVIKPKDPYLVGILIHRWETPWAKLFPLRLILRLGADYRYYPSPLISTRHRDSLFVEIGHTIINLLADFRNFSYTLPQIRGLTIHMEDKNTTVSIPVNRYDQVIKSINNSSDHILAFAGNFSLQADSHLVCIQDTQGNDNCYSTHAINIHNKPRKVTGASFIVFNGALKSSSGLTAKSNIVEDGLMIQVLPEHMQQIRDSLRAMKNHTIQCGCVNAVSDETVQIVWTENDMNFNVGVVSAIDGMSLNGIPSIRVHNGKNFICHNGSRIIRWTEVFIIQNGDDNQKNQDPVDISRVSENIAKATCDALVKYIDLLIANSFHKIGIRTTLQADNVSYLRAATE